MPINIDCITVVEFGKGFLRLIEIVSWPSVVILGILAFKKEIAAILPSVEEVGTNGVKFSRSATNKQMSEPEVNKQPNINLEASSNLPVPLYRLITRFEGQINPIVRDIVETARVPNLVRALAEIRTELAYERVYRVIYGSQISALKLLNESGPITREEGEEFLEKYRAEYSEFYRKYTFEQWVDFLIKYELVEIINNRYVITQEGKDFLTYILRLGLSEWKPF